MNFRHAISAFCFAVYVLLTPNSFAETATWHFSIDEQSVKNGPEPDGSTNSPGIGRGTVELDLETNVVSLDLAWEGMIGDLTKLHIHGPATTDMSNPQHIIEIFGPPAVPADLATTSGTWSDSFELQTLVQSGFDPIEPSEIIDAMIRGEAYLNVHTTVFGTGEIRGNLGLPVPEPNGTVMSVIGVAAAVVRRRRAVLGSSVLIGNEG